MKQDGKDVFFLSNISPRVHNEETAVKLREDLRYILSMVKEIEKDLNERGIEYTVHNWYSAIDDINEETFIKNASAQVLEYPEYFFGFIRFKDMDVCLCNNLCFNILNYKVFHTAPYQGQVAGVSLRNVKDNTATDYYLIEGGWTGKRIVCSILNDNEKLGVTNLYELYTSFSEKPISMLGNSPQRCIKDMLKTLHDVKFVSITDVSYINGQTQFIVLVDEWGERRPYRMTAYSLLEE